jgi:lipoyl(octanoyl) transferase
MMQIVDLGLISHAQAEAVQLERLSLVSEGAEDTLYLLEHPRTITLGRNGGRENLLVSDAVLAAEGIELVQTRRGGNITCHFPGQLVAYPVFRIASRPGGLRRFFFDLEEAVIRTLDHFGLAAGRAVGRPGVWIGPRKIASIGIGMRRWTSYHGVSLNVGRDLSLFRLITLCGLPGANPTSLHCELHDESISMQEVKHVCAREFSSVFAHPPVAAHQTAQ